MNIKGFIGKDGAKHKYDYNALANKVCLFGGYDHFYDSVARLRVNPVAPLSIDTYDGSGQLTHPCVRYFPDGWCRHKYWMAASPYPNSALDLENPCLWYSDNGYDWSADGIPNPLDLPLMVGGEQASMNSDPHLLVRPDGVMEVWWRTNYWENSGEGLYTVVYRRTSTDGINWTVKEELHRMLTNSADGIVCPVALHEDGVYKIWAVSDQECLRYYESATGSDWQRIRDIDVSNPDYPEYKVWHFDVNHTAKGYEFVGNYNIPGDYASHKYIYYAMSLDNITYSKRVMILARGATGNFDERLLYRPTIIRLDNKVMVYYGANDANNAWHIGQIEAPSAYLFNAVLIAGERIKAIESKNAQQEGRLAALEAGVVEELELVKGEGGTILTPEGTDEAPVLALYGRFADESVIIRGAAPAVQGNDVPNLRQVQELIGQGGSGGAGYVAADEPPEDTGALWVDTSVPAEAVALGVTAVETDEGVELYCTDELGTTKATVRHGKDGAPGAPGSTPVKGLDYFTEADVEEIAETAAGMVPGGGGAAKPWRYIGAIEVVEETGNWVEHGITVDADGNPFSLAEVSVHLPAKLNTGSYRLIHFNGAPGYGDYQSWIGTQENVQFAVAPDGYHRWISGSNPAAAEHLEDQIPGPITSISVNSPEKLNVGAVIKIYGRDA